MGLRHGEHLGDEQLLSAALVGGHGAAWREWRVEGGDLWGVEGRINGVFFPFWYCFGMIIYIIFFKWFLGFLVFDDFGLYGATT